MTNNSSFHERFENTVTMSNKIKAFGYELVEKWQYDFDRNIKTNPEFFNYVKDQPLEKMLR